MAPMLLDPAIPEPVQKYLLKEPPICSDPLVVPSAKASQRNKELWWLHGHPHSKRYANPELVSLSALVHHDSSIYRGQKAFLFPASPETSTKYESMTWDKFDSVTETIALAYAYQLQDQLKEANQTRNQPTVGLLGAGKNIEYFCTQIALQKLGVRVLLLAESNAVNALHFLLDSCDVLAVIVDSKNKRVDTGGIKKIELLESLPQSSALESEEVNAVKFQDFGDIWERHTFVIHSSGTTGMPKPIIHTNRSMMLIARMYRLFQEFNIENWFLLFPLYHIAGISVALSGLPNGQILSFPPQSWPPAPSSIFKAWETMSAMGYPVDCVHCAPTLIENMYDYIVENGKDFSPLASLKLLQPGGAVLSNGIIKDLTEHGVNVKTTYGSTEIGPPFRSVPHTRDNPEVYSFRNLYPDNPLLKMEAVGKGVYECVVYKGFDLAAELWEGKPNNEPYRTNDLFIQDPPGSGFYIMQGRKDDTLVHTNGENTSAGSLQLDIQTASKEISKALVLGHALPCPSLLVEIHEKHNPISKQMQDKVWQVVDKINTQYPTHSQIPRSMIYILPKGCSLPVTPKGNVKRKEVERIYATEIKQLYDDFLSPPTTTSHSEKSIREVIRDLFASLSGTSASNISDFTTIYDLGIDSRMSLTLRSSLSTHLNMLISLSAIYEHPSISQLAPLLEAKQMSLKSMSTSAVTASETPTFQTISHMISKLEFEFGTWPSRPLNKTYLPVRGEIILLTGSTGSLGTALLETLSSSPRVELIYAMVRGPYHFQKLQHSLEDKGMSASILRNGGKIKIVNFSMQDPLLGLDVDTYQQLASSVTMVIQNAWKMDFNMGVEEFENDCIRSTMSLLRFCYSGRTKSLAFTSSISTCMGTGQISKDIPESPIGSDPSVALSTGYAQSKYIIERISQTACLPEVLNIPIQMLRVGQMCGSTKTGHWNTNEMFPIMFATSAHPQMRAVPVFSKKAIDWIPVDVAAETITQILLPESTSKPIGLSKIGGYEVHNIVNPYPIAWSNLVDMLQNSSLVSKLGRDRLEEVSMAEWVRRLNVIADSDADTNDICGLRLLGFFEDMVGDNSESKIFNTKKGREKSKRLRDLGPFSSAWLEGNIAAWKIKNFLKLEA